MTDADQIAAALQIIRVMVPDDALMRQDIAVLKALAVDYERLHHQEALAALPFQSGTPDDIAAILARIKYRRDLWGLRLEQLEAVLADYEARGAEITRLAIGLDSATKAATAYAVEVEKLTAEIDQLTAEVTRRGLRLHNLERNNESHKAEIERLKDENAKLLEDNRRFGRAVFED